MSNMSYFSQMLLENASNSIYLNPLSYFLPLLFILFFLYQWLSNNSSDLQNIPSPPKHPFFGHLLKLGAYPHRTLKALSDQYGDLMLLYFGKRPTLIVSSSKVAKEIMKTNDAIFSNRARFIISDKLLYNCRDVASCLYGEYWRQMKSIIMVQLLNNKRVKSYKGIRAEETALMVEKIKENKSSIVNLSQLFSDITNDVTCRVACGKKSSEHKLSGVNFKEISSEFVELIGVFNIADYLPWLGWVINKFTGLDARLERVAKSFDLVLENIINEHSERLNKIGTYSDDESENEAKDFVDVLLRVQKENSTGFPLERDSLKALIMDLFAAGTDTTFTVIEWAMSQILRNPNVMKKLQNEIREIVGDKEYVSEDDLDQMTYLKAVFNETLRLHPPLPLLVPRESTHDAKINGYTIPAGTMVFINAWAIQRDPLTWDEPDEFRPERFLNYSMNSKQQDFEMLPFGSGRRICPGKSFALTNNELVLANLIHKFNWELPHGVKPETMDMTESMGATTSHRKNPLLAISTPRI